MRSVYFIIPTAGIGGTEKRFIELWCYLRQHDPQFDFKLIISGGLYDAFKQNPPVYEQLLAQKDNILVYNISFKESLLRFQRKLYSFVCEHTTSDDILHFILSYPTYIFPIGHPKTVYSLTESSLSNVNFKGRLLYLLNVLRAKYIDILDPVVFKKIHRNFRYKNKRISLTPGSFTDTSDFKPVEGYKKENWFVFLGRFFYVKQVLKLLEALPEVCSRLNEAGFDTSSFKFIFIGYGQQGPTMQQIIQAPAFKGLPVQIMQTYQPEEILSKSKVFFSLQLRNNYPSKSLLEGMAAGNIPLVTDIGTTRTVARPDFSYYVPEDFSALDIANQLISILTLDTESLQAKMRAARDFVVNNFNISSSAAYYQDLYKKF